MLFGKKDNVPYHIRVDEKGNFELTLTYFVRKSRLASFFYKLKRRFPVQADFADIERDSFSVPKQYLRFIFAKLKKTIKKVEQAEQQKVKIFKILVAKPHSCKFNKISDDAYQVQVVIKGLCKVVR